MNLQFNGYGIRFKLLVTMVGLIICLLAILTSIQITIQKKVLSAEQEHRFSLRKKILIERGKTLSENLANQIENDLAVFNISNIIEVVSDSVNDDKELSYVVLMDANQKAYVSTLNSADQGEYLDEPEDVFASLQVYPALNSFAKNGSSILEFIVPLQISTERWGVLRLGYSLNLLNHEIFESRKLINKQNQRLIKRSVAIACLFVFVGSLIILYIATKLANPISDLTQSVHQLEKRNFTTAANIKIQSNDEVGVLASAFVKMSENLKTSYEKLEDYNRTLELKVKDRTQELSKAFDELKLSQERLVESEKMASLGELVAGVAHEINTPVGIGVTVSSHLVKLTKSINTSFENKELKKSELKEFLEKARESGDLILKNLLHTGELVKSFKMVSADQVSRERRRFNLKSYLNDVILSLDPRLKKVYVSIEIECPDDIEIDSYPGIFAQVLTNLIVNTLNHGYNEGEHIVINIVAMTNENELILIYHDEGKGIPIANIKKIFDPFFTTKRGHGENTGLGLHIVYNLVSQSLKGIITCESIESKYTIFTIKMPLHLYREE